ncbi:MAG: T9SS type A sorting domain-containing protein [Chitinophagaceae bacterium]|nr:T9SS type A sorting domain-containing protein [Chitinophagaceae bacterium]
MRLAPVLILLLMQFQAQSQAWESLGIGIGNPGRVICSAYDSTNDLLYVGGMFKFADGQEMNSIACFNGTNWTPVGGGVFNGTYQAIVEQMAFLNGILYVSGSFNMAGKTNCFGSFAAWDGSHWSSIPFMPGFKVVRLFAFENKLFIASYQEVTGTDKRTIFTWDGNKLENASAGLGDWSVFTNYDPIDFTIRNDQLMVSADFDSMSIGRWNGASWIAEYNGANGNQHYPIISYHDTLLVDDAGTLKFLKNHQLISLSIFGTPGGMFAIHHDTLFVAQSSGNIYRLNENGTWILTGDASGNYDSYVDEISHLQSCDMGLFVGGAMTTINGKYAIGLSKWNGAQWDSVSMFSSPDGEVSTLIYDSLNNWLYAGGDFRVAGEKMVNNIARWDGSSWHDLNDGVSSSVKSFALIDTTLYALMNYNSYNLGTYLGSLGKWNGISWSKCSDATFLQEQKIFSSEDTLYLCGGSGHVKLNAGNCIWPTVGNLFNEEVYDVTKFKGQLFAGGKGSMIENANFAIWNGSAWSVPAYLEGSIVSFTHFHDSLFISLYNSHFMKSGDGINWIELDSTHIGTLDYSVTSSISHNDQLIASLNNYKALLTLQDTGWVALQPYFDGTVNCVVSYDSFMVAGGSVYNFAGYTWPRKAMLDKPKADFIFNDTTVCEGMSSVKIINRTSSPVNFYKWSVDPVTASSTSDLSFFDPKIYFDSAGTYAVTLIVSNIFGKDTVTKTAHVSIQPKPNVYITGNHETCYGDSLELTVHGGESYFWGANTQNITSWFDSVIQIFPQYGYIFIATGYDNLGCSDTGQVKVYINDTAKFTLNPFLNPFICNGDSVMLTVQGNPISYKWLPSESLNVDTGAVALAFPSATTTYTVTSIDNASGCTYSLSKKVNVDFYGPLIISASDSLKCPGSYGILHIDGYSGSYAYQWLFNGTEITGANSSYYYALDTGLYSCIIHASLCTKNDTLNFFLHSVPLINMTIEPFSDYCQSEPNQPLPAATPPGGIYYVDSYFNYSNEVAISDLAVGTHVIKYILPADTFGCAQYITDTFEIIPGIEVTYDMPLDTICIYHPPFLLTGGIPEGGTYSGDGVASNIFYPYDANGGTTVVTYSYQDSTGCTGYAEDTIMVYFCIGIESVPNTDELTVYPNPTSGQFSILQKSNIPFAIGIYDLNGLLVYPKHFFNSREKDISIDCSYLSAGLYILSVESGKSKHFLKLSIMK